MTYPDHKVIVFEKETAVGQHQTGHNSGVVHSGLYYTPGSLKAKLTREGVDLLKAYSTTKSIDYREIGKLVIARDAIEVERLRELERRGVANGVPDLRWLTAAEIQDLEPGATGVAALYSPTTAIIDYPAVTRALADDVVASGGQVRLGCEVRGISRQRAGVWVQAGSASTLVSQLVICAGLQSDRVAELAGDGPDPQIVPFRGEYLRLRPGLEARVRHLIYPVPDPQYPFLGVHVTPRVDGHIDLGPNAVLAFAREGYTRSTVKSTDVGALVRSRAMRKLARQHWRTGVHEMRGSLWRRSFVAEARTYIPWLTMKDVVVAPAGVRAQAVDADGSLVDDFRFGGGDGVLSLRNAPSPGATASLAIARYVVGRVQADLATPAP